VTNGSNEIEVWAFGRWSIGSLNAPESRLTITPKRNTSVIDVSGRAKVIHKVDGAQDPGKLSPVRVQVILQARSPVHRCKTIWARMVKERRKDNETGSSQGVFVGTVGHSNRRAGADTIEKGR